DVESMRPSCNADSHKSAQRPNVLFSAAITCTSHCSFVPDKVVFKVSCSALTPSVGTLMIPFMKKMRVFVSGHCAFNVAGHSQSTSAASNIRRGVMCTQAMVEFNLEPGRGRIYRMSLVQ